MRIAIDATPGATQHGGVGRYARELLRALVALPTDHSFLVAVAASDEAAGALIDGLPPGAWRELRRLPLNERWMTALWQRLRLPVPIERFTGPHDLYHGTDFTLPPGGAAKVVTIHDLSFLLHREFAQPELADYLSAAVPRAIDRADAVITVSASVAAEVADHYPASRDKLIAIPNGVRVPERRYERRESETPTILMVGTIEPRKNHLTALRAFGMLRSAFTDAKLVVVGRPGWQSDDIRRELHDAEVQGGVRWLPDADDDALERAYAEATAFISPSHYEGFGLPVLEALVRGLPVVASDISAHREVAGDAALYAPPDDENALADHLTTLLNDPDRRARLAECGPRHAARFTWGESARRTMRVYAALTGGNRR